MCGPSLQTTLKNFRIFLKELQKWTTSQFCCLYQSHLDIAAFTIFIWKQLHEFFWAIMSIHDPAKSCCWEAHTDVPILCIIVEYMHCFLVLWFVSTNNILCNVIRGSVVLDILTNLFIADLLQAFLLPNFTQNSCPRSLVK